MFAIRQATIGGMMVFALSMALSCPPRAEAGDRLDVSYVPPGSALGAVIYPRRILRAPAAAMHPAVGDVTDQLRAMLGFDPSDIERLDVILGPIEGDALPEVGLVFHLAKPHAPQAAFPGLRERTTEGVIGGKAYLHAGSPGDLSLYADGDRTLLAAEDGLLRKMLANRRDPSLTTVSGVLHRYDDSNDVLVIALAKPLVAVLAARLPADAPPEMTRLLELSKLVKTFGIKTTLSGGPSLTLGARCTDKAAAREARRILDVAIKTLKKDSSVRFFLSPGSVDPAQAVMAAEMHKQFVKFADVLRPVRKGDRLEIDCRAGAAGMIQMELARLAPLVLPSR